MEALKKHICRTSEHIQQRILNVVRKEEGAGRGTNIKWSIFMQKNHKYIEHKKSLFITLHL